MSVASYWGVGPSELEEFKKELGTNPDYGTYHRDIARYANELGLNAQIKWGITKSQYKALLLRRIPVILSLQAWADDRSVYDNPDHNKDGHYIAGVGYDSKDNFYFMDPSITARYGYLPWNELNRRWHEDEGFEEAEIHSHLGIIIRPGKRRPGPQAAYIG